MAKTTKKNQTRGNGSSNRKVKNGNGGKGKEAVQEPEEKKNADASSTESEEPKEKKRRGRAPTEGDPLEPVLIFLSDDDIAALKAEVGDRGMSTKIREIIKTYLAKRG